VIAKTSVLATTGLAGQVHYAAAKAGVAGMIKSIAQESAERGVTANCIAPGFLAIPMAGVSYSPSQSEAFLASIPAGRFESASEIAAAAVFLASDEAAYITGQPLHINGGLLESKLKSKVASAFSSEDGLQEINRSFQAAPFYEPASWWVGVVAAFQSSPTNNYEYFCVYCCR
jgi:short-subunit dehydrogenase